MTWVTSWNQSGVQWRNLSFAEIMWLVHTDTIQRMKESAPNRVRLYLTETKDYTALREWDNSQLKDSQDK